MNRQPAQPAPIFSLLKCEIEDFFSGIGQPAYRAGQVLDWLYRKRAGSFDGMSNLPAGLRAAVAQAFSFSAPECVRKLGSSDTTQKFLLRLGDGQLIESVLIPASPALHGSRSDRRTICVSTQVGCAYGCKFCASGLDGWTRNLTADEIVGQLMVVGRESCGPINNIVFMGMGEPLANYENLLRAVRIINADWGLGVGARHITISTSGLVPQIRRLADEPMQLRLAVSLHGATDEVRDRIMPVNRKYPVGELLDACRYFCARRKQMLTFEYILIDGVNDSIEQARILAREAGALRAKVNLIPCNSVDGLDWQRPPLARQNRFFKVLTAAGVAATIRREKGHDIDAACGQLRRQSLPR